LSTDVATILCAAAAYGTGTALAALFLAPRADVVGPDRALRAACAILVLALTVSAIAPDVSLLILGQALAGLGAGVALPTIYVLAVQVAPEGQKKQTIGFVLSGWTFSLIGGVTISALMADYLGWYWVYVLMAVLTAIVWFLLSRCQFAPDQSETSEIQSSPFTALQLPGIWRGLLSNAMLMLAFNGAYLYLGSHIVENLGRSTSAAGALTMFYGIGFGLASFLNHRLEMVSLRTAGVLAFAGLSVIYLLMDLSADAFLLLLPIALVWGVFQHLALNMVVERLTDIDPFRRGAIMGMNSAVTYVTVVGGALLYRLPYEIGGLAACLGFSALFAVIACIESLWPRGFRTYSAAE
jgi:predicted MFS family arabinose efflux permease